MKICSLIENTSQKNFPVEHGLSLFIETENGKKILFDMGQSSLFVQNAERLGIDLKTVDFAVISHGHYDHGGGLPFFLEINKIAPVYIRKSAFEPHFSLHEGEYCYNGIDNSLLSNDRLIFTEDFHQIDSQIFLFSNVENNEHFKVSNSRLFGPQPSVCDVFQHEQNLLICDGNNVILFAGCAHCGIVSIMKKAENLAQKKLTHVFGGFHLMKSDMSVDDELKNMETLASELKKFAYCQIVTMHCTGVRQYNYLKLLLKEQIQYLSCGEEIEIGV